MIDAVIVIRWKSEMITKRGIVTDPRALNIGVLVVVLCNLSVSAWLACRYSMGLPHSLRHCSAFLCALISAYCWCNAVGCIVNAGFSCWLKREVLLWSVGGYLLMCAALVIGK